MICNNYGDHIMVVNEMKKSMMVMHLPAMDGQLSTHDRAKDKGMNCRNEVAWYVAGRSSL